MSRPANFLLWAKGNAADVIEPPSGTKATGWALPEPEAEYMNWLFKTMDDWFAYLEEVTGGWPDLSCSNEAEFATALASALSNGGGVISVRQGFDLTGPHTVPPNTVLTGRDGASVLNVTAATGDPVLQIDQQAVVQHLRFTNAKTTGNIIEMVGRYARLQSCEIVMDSLDAVTGVSVENYACGIRDCVLEGASGGTAVGFNFLPGVSAESFEEQNRLLP